MIKSLFLIFFFIFSIEITVANSEIGSVLEYGEVPSMSHDDFDCVASLDEHPSDNRELSSEEENKDSSSNASRQ